MMKLKFRKFLELRRSGLNKSGIILLIVLWTLVILGIMAVGLGRSTNINLAITKHTIGKVQAKYLAWAGILFAVEQVRLDTEHEEYANRDDLFRCGISPDVASPNELFQKTELGEGFYTIVFRESSEHGKSNRFYGLQDEERKININAMTVQTVAILKSLLNIVGVDETAAEQITHSVIDWVDADEVVDHTDYPAESEYYSELEKPYRSKNKPFDSLEELLLARGMTPDIYKKVRDYLTIFPKEGGLKINFDTAPRTVLLALMQSVAGELTNTQTEDAVALVDKLIQFRSGEDGIPATSDDRLIDPGALGLNAKEQTIFQAVGFLRTTRSNFFRVNVRGVIPGRDVETRIEAVIAREDLSVLAWKRE